MSSSAAHARGARMALIVALCWAAACGGKTSRQREGDSSASTGGARATNSSNSSSNATGSGGSSGKAGGGGDGGSGGADVGTGGTVANTTTTGGGAAGEGTSPSCPFSCSRAVSSSGEELCECAHADDECERDSDCGLAYDQHVCCDRCAEAWPLSLIEAEPCLTEDFSPEPQCETASCADIPCLADPCAEPVGVACENGICVLQGECPDGWFFVDGRCEAISPDADYVRDCEAGDFICNNWDCEGWLEIGECYKPCTPDADELIGAVDSECDEPERPFCGQVPQSLGGDFDCNGCTHVCVAEEGVTGCSYSVNWCF